jgi:hypothetical protein
MSQQSHEAYEVAIEALLSVAAEDLRRSATPQAVRGALCRYLKRGSSAGFSTGELVDFLGVSTPSLLERAGFSDAQADEAMRILASIDQAEIEACSE